MGAALAPQCVHLIYLFFAPHGIRFPAVFAGLGHFIRPLPRVMADFVLQNCLRISNELRIAESLMRQSPAFGFP